MNWLKGKFKANPLDSMNDAKEKVKQLDSVDQLEAAFKKANEIAEKIDMSGQYELAFSIRKSATQIAQEIVLKKNGIDKCLEEKDILEVLQKADFGMRIDFLEHYPQILPDEIANKKIKIDELNIFDNYAVLHFDPNGSSLKIQNAEEIRRDPILFGMIKNSTRLYFIADWVIGNDDITLEKVEKILGRSALPAQFISSQYGNIVDDFIMEESDETESTAI